MNKIVCNKKEFGDFQTPEYLADEVCEKIKQLGVCADTIIEPTCGIGGFVMSAMKIFPEKAVLGFDINHGYIEILKNRLKNSGNTNVKILKADFFTTDWKKTLSKIDGSVLVLGNLPWVTNSQQGSIGGNNLPEKNNFLNFKGFDAITGKANFDISEWMLLEIISWFEKRHGSIAMLMKTAVARKIIAHAEKNGAPLTNAIIFKINAKAAFNASVDACLLILDFNPNKQFCYDYSIYDSLTSETYTKIGHRDGLTVSNLAYYEKYSYLIGDSLVKWRSGIKHDLSAIMELTKKGDFLFNGLGEKIDIEPDLLFPLMKGSDVGTEKAWRNKYVLVTQSFVGQDTLYIRDKFPKTWTYLVKHSDKLDARGSIIYKKNPRFSIFGVGEYTFKPWKIAICGLYKSLNFRLIGPINEKPTVFDDTVYFISFNSKTEAQSALSYLQKNDVIALLDSLIFWDDKRPVKTSILNSLKWEDGNLQHNLFYA